MTISPSSGIGASGLNGGAGIGSAGLSASAGAAPAFDPDSVFDAGLSGDFWQPSGAYQDSPPTVPADENGDVVFYLQGSRTAGTNIDPVQSSAASRPSMATDATHGLVFSYLASSTKVLVAAGGSINPTTNGIVMGARVYIPADNTGVTGHCFAGQDSSAPANLIGVNGKAGDDTLNFGVTTSDDIEVALTPYFGSWITVVATMDPSKNAALYINDINTPVATGTLSNIVFPSRIYIGHTSAFTQTILQYKTFAINDYDVTALSNWKEWLEA